MNRLFNAAFGDMPNSGTGGPPRRWMPAMDLLETDDDFVLRADLPGMTESDVNVELEDNVLTISGERKSEQEEKREGFYRVERAFGSFSRSLTLPQGVDPDAVNASFDKGVLEVRVPKPERRKPRRISIGSGSQEPRTLEGAAA
jgi:HSP20 family protein